jgi:general secretion pathway protein K
MMSMNNKRGMALLITMSVMIVLVAYGLELSREVRTTLESVATGHRDRTTLSYMAAGGIQVAMGLLAQHKQDPPEVAIREDLAISESLNDALSEIPFEKGKLSVHITDELAKFQINALIKFPEGREANDAQIEILTGLIAPKLGKNEKKRVEFETILNRILDFLDSGDDGASRSPGETEPDNYRNGPFTDLTELLIIKGITQEFIDSLGGFQELSKYITIYGMTTKTGTTPSPNADVKRKNFTFEGKININTAELPVLIALMGGNAEMAADVLKYREEMMADQYVPDWYKSLPALSALASKGIITGTSDFYRIEAEAELDDVKMKISTLIHREQDKKTGKWICRILRWQTE